MPEFTCQSIFARLKHTLGTVIHRQSSYPQAKMYPLCLFDSAALNAENDIEYTLWSVRMAYNRNLNHYMIALPDYLIALSALVCHVTAGSISLGEIVRHLWGRVTRLKLHEEAKAFFRSL